MPSDRSPAPLEGSESPVAPGDVLAGKYRVDRILGAGGMGLVVAATHLTIHQRVALKFLRPDAARMPETKERFLREAQAAVRLKSEHVAKVLDVGTLEDGSPYMVMEYLEGSTLGDVVRKHGPLPVADAVSHVVQACEAVAEAHAAGIVHRDIKPDNLFLTRSVHGRPLVKVLDFGIAKTLGVDLHLSLTRTATIVGSPLYMPPEQLRSAKHVDVRADIWALGAVLFELVAGRPPFVAESFSELCLKVATDPTPTPSSVQADVPTSLDAVVVRCLEKDPAKRFQNVGELADALQAFASESVRDFARRVSSVLKMDSQPAPPPPPEVAPTSTDGGTLAKANTGTAWGHTSAGALARRRRLAWWVGGAGAALVSAAAAVAVVSHPAAPAPSGPAAAAATAPGAAAVTTTNPPAVSLEAPVAVPPSVTPSVSEPSAAPSPQPPPRRAPPAAAPVAHAPSASPPSSASAAPAPTTSAGDIVFQRK
jgi:serine/threonine protein kinase